MVSKILVKLRAFPGRVFRLVLQYAFTFDRWHITPLVGRNYAEDIIAFLNSKPKESRYEVIEIGCGLGDIIRHLDYQKKIGYDSEDNVLRAASFLSRISRQKNIIYKSFEFPITPLNEMVNTIILVNWIHHIEPDVLKMKMEDYFENHLLPGGEIIIDTVQDKAYRINHQVSFIVQNLNCTLIKIGDYLNEREVFAIRKKK